MYLLPVNFRQIQFSDHRSLKYLSQSEAWAAIFVFDRSKNTNLVEDVKYTLPFLLPINFSLIPSNGYREVKLSRLIRSQCGHLCCPVQYVRPVKVRQIPFSSFGSCALKVMIPSGKLF